MSSARRAYAKKNSPVILSESVSPVTDEVIRRRQEQALNDLARALAVRLGVDVKVDK